jgi:hypothetical protein
MFASLADWINRVANEGFDRTHRQNPDADEMWDKVDSMQVIDDKLVITTKAAAANASPSP